MQFLVPAQALPLASLGAVGCGLNRCDGNLPIRKGTTVVARQVHNSHLQWHIVLRLFG